MKGLVLSWSNVRGCWFWEPRPGVLEKWTGVPGTEGRDMFASHIDVNNCLSLIS